MLVPPDMIKSSRVLGHWKVIGKRCVSKEKCREMQKRCDYMRESKLGPYVYGGLRDK